MLPVQTFAPMTINKVTWKRQLKTSIQSYIYIDTFDKRLIKEQQQKKNSQRLI